MNVGTPNTSRRRPRPRVRVRISLAGHPASTSAKTASASTPPRVRASADHRRIAQVAAFVVTGREQGPVDGEELVGEPVPDHDAGRQGQRSGCWAGSSQAGRPLRHMGLVEEEGNEGHVPGGPGLESVDDVLMAVSGRTGTDSPRSRRKSSYVSMARATPQDRRIHSGATGPSTRRSAGPGPVRAGSTDQAQGGTDAAPPITSEAWWARRWRRLNPDGVAAVKSRALPLRSPRRLMTVTAQKAAKVCPLGKLLEVGSRTGTPDAVNRSPSGSGRESADDGLEGPALTTVDSMPAMTERPDRLGPVRTAVAGPPHGGRGPHDPVVTEAGDHFGRPVEGGIPRSGSNQASTRSSTDRTRAARPRPGRHHRGSDRRSRSHRPEVGPVSRCPRSVRTVSGRAHAAPAAVAPSTTAASSGSPP